MAPVIVSRRSVTPSELIVTALPGPVAEASIVVPGPPPMIVTGSLITICSSHTPKTSSAEPKGGELTAACRESPASQSTVTGAATALPVGTSTMKAISRPPMSMRRMTIPPASKSSLKRTRRLEPADHVTHAFDPLTCQPRSTSPGNTYEMAALVRRGP